MSLPYVPGFVRTWTPDTWTKFRAAYDAARARATRLAYDDSMRFRFDGYRFVLSYAKLLLEDHDTEKK